MHRTRTAGGDVMIIDLAGLLATAILLVTLVALEVRRVGPDTVPTSAGDRPRARHAAPSGALPRFAAVTSVRRHDGRHQRPRVEGTRTTGGALIDLAGTVSRRTVVIMWMMYLLLVLPRVLGLLA
ncbi:hypothetical protein D6T63_00850 [Arthrobacter cheniae]|uniref:Uncharacterized protein n=1 Tax=Arthrobacter cheniae TaxID=1258888 RepID=A0A3A5M7B6_9MICC|nr:hypothetical protein [Arthrobacter cheniae]RJT83042.1 hypothetical protein D6T63_00850 [Arthrobacter cheniae]